MGKDIIKSINEAIKILSENNVSKPFTVYIDESQYSKEVIDEMKKTYCYNVILKFVPRGTSLENILAVQDAIGEQVK